MKYSRTLALGAFVLAAAFGVALAEDKKEEVPDVDTIMTEAHGKGGLRAQVDAAQKAKKLADAQKPADKWAKLASAMAKNKPPKGEAASWKKLCDDYEKCVKGVAKAVKDDKDAEVTKAQAKVQATCKGCHETHRE